MPTELAIVQTSAPFVFRNVRNVSLKKEKIHQQQIAECQRVSFVSFFVVVVVPYYYWRVRGFSRTRPPGPDRQVKPAQDICNEFPAVFLCFLHTYLCKSVPKFEKGSDLIGNFNEI